jgi:hypothetical protein
MKRHFLNIKLSKNTLLICFIILIIIFIITTICSCITYEKKEHFELMTAAPTYDENPYFINQNSETDPVKRYQVGLELVDDNTLDYIKKYFNDKIDDIPSTIYNFDEMDDTIDSTDLYSMDLDTMGDKWYEYDPDKDFNIPTVKTDDDTVNYLMTEIQIGLNKSIPEMMSNTLIRQMGILPYFVYDYKIIKYTEKQNQKRIQLYCTIIREKSYLAVNYEMDFTLFKNIDSAKTYLYLNNISVLGTQTTDELLLPKGNFATPYMMNKLYEKENIGRPLNFDPTNTSEMSNIKELEVLRQDAINNFAEYQLRNTSVCFNTNPDFRPGSDASVINTEYSKEECERGYDFLGRSKNRGVWDSPCTTDDECPFYQTNQNYTNTRGSCNKNSGKCELPKNVLPIGYHHYEKHSKTAEPLCYNCEPNEIWKPITKLGKCCHLQSDKTKYPNLTGPDYAYPADSTDRWNYDKQKQYNDSLKR